MAHPGVVSPCVLLIAYGYPPENIAGAARPFRFATYLPRFGYTPLVLTASPQSDPAPGHVTQVPERTRFFAKAVRKFVFPGEDAIGWIGPALAASAALAARLNVAAVFSSYSPTAAHVVAWRLKRRFGLRWIADFRDPLRGNLTRLHHAYPAFDAVFEPLVFRRADILIANTDAVADMWRRRYPQHAHKIHVIWNGFDPAETVEPAPIPPRPYRVLAHTGEVTEFRHPGILLRALARLAARGALDPSAIRLQLIGSAGQYLGDPDTARWLKEKGVLELAPLLAPAEANRRLAEADYLLLVDITTGITGLQVPSKLFNYLRLGRPVLALTTSGSPVDRILARSGVPAACLYPDLPTEETDRRLLAFLASPSEPVRASRWFWETFDGVAQTRALASLVDGLLGREHARPSGVCR